MPKGDKVQGNEVSGESCKNEMRRIIITNDRRMKKRKAGKMRTGAERGMEGCKSLR